MKYLFSSYYFLAILIAFSYPYFSAYAQEIDENKVQSKIELIIFKHNDVSNKDLHQLLEIEQLDIANPIVEFELFSRNLPPVQNESEVIPVTNYQLTTQYIKLANAKEFDVLSHVAWLQPRYQYGQAGSGFISFVPSSRNGLLKGLAYISYDNLYQIKLHLLYESSLLPESGLQQNIPQAQMLNIHYIAVMKKDKLYYFDHSVIGIIALITEREAPADVKIKDIEIIEKILPE